MATLRTLARPILSVNELAYRRRWTRSVYKSVARLRQRPLAQGSASILAALPETDRHRVPRDIGFRSYPSGNFPGPVEAAVATGRLLAEGRTGPAWTKASKPWMQHLLREDDLVRHPEFVELGIDPGVAAIVADYLDELPVLTSVWIWRSIPVAGSFDESQLLHADFDDLTQLKLFVHLDDVTDSNGPLLAYAAPDSARAMARIGYLAGEHGHLDDESAKVAVGESTPVLLTGRAGTVDAVDTSRLLHRGSRDMAAPRLVLGYQYVTHTSFLVNAVRRKAPYPLASLAVPGLDPLGRALLRGRP